MADNYSTEIFELEEFTMRIIVPQYWNDDAVWNDFTTWNASNVMSAAADQTTETFFDDAAAWNDAATWSDYTTQAEGVPLTTTAEMRGIFSDQYQHIDLGEAGQDSTIPTLRFPTALVPHAREGDEITVYHEQPDATGQIQTTPRAYHVATVAPTGTGETECLLYAA